MVDPVDVPALTRCYDWLRVRRRRFSLCTLLAFLRNPTYK